MSIGWYIAVQLAIIYHYTGRGAVPGPDTVVPAPGNPQSLNRYTYVLNNRLRYTDPTGNVYDEGGGVAGGDVPHYDFPEVQWQAVESWAQYFDLPVKFVATR